MSKSFIHFILVLSLCPLVLKGQKGPEAGLWLGAATYYGDLKTTVNAADLGLAGGANFRYNFNDRISYKLSLNYLRLHAEDANSSNTFQVSRNLSFFADVFDVSHQMEFNFLPYRHGSENNFYTPYLFGGLSSFFYNPKANLDFDLDGVEETYVLRDFGTEGQAFGEEYGRFSMALNYGIGFKFDLNADWSINVEFMGHRTYTDYLDDVSTIYPDRNELIQLRGDIALALSDRSDPALDISRTGNQRGNPNDKDYYYTFGISIMKYFGDLACPKIGKVREER